MPALEARLRDGLKAMGLNQDLAPPCARYLRLLEKWNRAYNLTAVREPAQMVDLHILDSLTARPFLHGNTVLDVGSGAGLPGIPLALFEPQRSFTLLDSGGKKTRFMRHAVAELGLQNVDVVDARAEAFDAEAGFDTVICRAFNALRDFVLGCGRLAASGGRLVAMKGRLPDEELSVLPVGWIASSAEPVNIPGLDVRRHIIVLERKAGGE